MQRKFVREEQNTAKVEGKLYSSFAEWLTSKYGDEPSLTDWQVIQAEEDAIVDIDEELSQQSSKHAVVKITSPFT